VSFQFHRKREKIFCIHSQVVQSYFHRYEPRLDQLLGSLHLFHIMNKRAFPERREVKSGTFQDDKLGFPDQSDISDQVITNCAASMRENKNKRRENSPSTKRLNTSNSKIKFAVFYFEAPAEFFKELEMRISFTMTISFMTISHIIIFAIICVVVFKLLSN